jgi:branched-chain amino acid transport system ATP-binding protein
MAVLAVQGLTMRFGGITAVNRADFAVEPGQIFSVIGPNGAGKTTVFNAVTGIYEPTEGDVLFEGHPIRAPFTWKTGLFVAAVGLLTAFAGMILAVNIDLLWKRAVRDIPKAEFTLGKAVEAGIEHIKDRSEYAIWGAAVGLFIGTAGALLAWKRSRRSPDVISQEGIARTFQNIRLFQSMTVLENILVGMTRSIATHPVLASLNIGHKQERAAEKRAAELLAFVGLAGKHNELAKNLAYGDQRRLEIARALATEPKLLLLDEPAAGMNPSECADLMALITASPCSTTG